MQLNQNKKQQFELADILNAADKKYYHNTRAAKNIQQCRTEALGGHTTQCQNEKCGKLEVQYNSCNNRSCPKCSFKKQHDWVLKLAKNIFPVKHFHVVFTIPHEFNNFFLYNKSEFSNLLFKSSAQALMQSVATKWNVKAGHTSIIHTWGSALTVHPHVHMIVPAGGISLKNGEWVSFKKQFLAHKKVLFLLFRKIFMKGIKKLIKDGELVIPSCHEFISKNEASFLDFFNKPHSKKWNVHIQKAFGNEMQVIKYLGRYTHRIAISNSRIKNLDVKNKKMSFQYKNYKSGNLQDSLTLTLDEFLRRFFHHIPEKGFVRIRHGGICGNSVKVKYVEIARAFVYGSSGIPTCVLKEVYFLERKLERIIQKLETCECGGEVIPISSGKLFLETG